MRPSGAAEKCGCAYCRNFAEARAVVFSDSLQALLVRMGIDWQKEDEAAEHGLLPSGLRVYLPWFSCVGRVVERDPSVDEPELSVSPAGGSRLQINLRLEVPWVINEDEPNW